MILQISFTTLKGAVKDRTYKGVLFATIAFLAIPVVSIFSLRQVTSLATTLSLSLSSFILFFIAVFLGGTSLWKDIERKYVYSTLGMPITRSSFLIGKYIGLCSFIAITVLVLSLLSFGAIWFTAGTYPPDRPILWQNIFWALLLDGIKYSVLISTSFLFSSVSTSFFLPIFGTISTYMAGSATQSVFDYLQTEQGQQVPFLTAQAAKLLYYILPNYGAFDISNHAIYSIPLQPTSLFYTTLYGISYAGIMLALACLLFSKRDLQ